MSVSIPEGWKVKNFGVELKPGKPEDASAWFDIKGRPVVKVGSVWSLQKQKPAPPRKVVPKQSNVANDAGGSNPPPRPKPAPPRKVTPKQPDGAVPQKPATLNPKEEETYGAFSSLAKEKIANGTKKSFYPDPEQAAQDEEQRKARFAPYVALSDNQLSAINAYTSEWDTNMNSLLRSGKITPSDSQRFGQKPIPSETLVKKAVSDLTSALEQLPSAPSGTFHRAVSGSVWAENAADGRDASAYIKKLLTLEEGDVMEDPGFSSFTSGGAPVVDQFLMGDPNSNQNIVFEVESDGMKNIAPISRYEREKEHMLPPNSRFKVIGKREGRSRKAGTHTVIVLQHLT
jgi:hypothetical protein